MIHQDGCDLQKSRRLNHQDEGEVGFFLIRGRINWDHVMIMILAAGHGYYDVGAMLGLGPLYHLHSP